MAGQKYTLRRLRRALRALGLFGLLAFMLAGCGTWSEVNERAAYFHRPTTTDDCASVREHGYMGNVIAERNASRCGR